MNEQYVKLAVYGMIIAFVLLQWFMCERPWFIWGLALPIIFAVAWFCVVKQPLSIFEALGLTEAAIELMSNCCKLGIVASGAEFAVIRGFRLLRDQRGKRQREERLEEKRRRELREAALLAHVQPGQRPPGGQERSRF